MIATIAAIGSLALFAIVSGIGVAELLRERAAIKAALLKRPIPPRRGHLSQDEILIREAIERLSQEGLI